MPGYWWYDPNNPATSYRTMLANDPNVPNGYVLSGGTDGAIDVAQQTFQPGAASGGWPPYPAGGTLADLKNLNGSRSPGASNGPY